MGLGGEVYFDGFLLFEAGSGDCPVGGGGDGVVAGLVVDVPAVGVFVVGFVFGVSGVGDGCGHGSLGVGGGGRSRWWCS